MILVVCFTTTATAPGPSRPPQRPCWAPSPSCPRVRARDHSREGERRSGAREANGTKLGRRRVDPTVEARILELKADGDGILKIGRKLGIGTSVVQRVFKQEPRPS